MLEECLCWLLVHRLSSDRMKPCIRKMSPFHSGSTASSLEHRVVSMQTWGAEMVLKNQHEQHHAFFKVKLQPESGTLITCLMLLKAL